METMQMHLSQKEGVFSALFSPFSKSILNFEHFEKNMTLIAFVFPKLQTWKGVVGLMSKSSCLREPLNTRHGKLAKTLIQS